MAGQGNVAHANVAPMTEAEAKRVLREHYRAWDQKVQDMREASSKVDWSKTDWSKLNPKDVGVSFGPMMTEEQFAEYRKTRNVQVLKKPNTSAPAPK